MHDLTPEEAIALAGSTRRLAAMFSHADGAEWSAEFPISRQAIQQWRKAGRIPPGRVLELMRIKPAWFKKRAEPRGVDIDAMHKRKP